jgi:hypothetical protein
MVVVLRSHGRTPGRRWLNPGQDPDADIVVARPAVRAVPGAGVDVHATLLLGLVGGLIGRGAAMAGWTATTRRRLHRAAAA